MDGELLTGCSWVLMSVLNTASSSLFLTSIYLNLVNAVIKSVLWIVFNADPDPTFFYLNADPDLDPGSQTNADPDPDPGQTFMSQKVEFYNFKGRKASLLVNFGQKTGEE